MNRRHGSGLSLPVRSHSMYTSEIGIARSGGSEQHEPHGRVTAAVRSARGWENCAAALWRPVRPDRRRPPGPV